MKFLANLWILIFRVLTIGLFREEWAAEEIDTTTKTDVEEGYEYKELPGVHMNEEEKRAFAKEHNLDYKQFDKKPAQKKEDPPPAGTDTDDKNKGRKKDDAEIVEVTANEQITLAKAEELVKDFEDDDEIEVQGETYTKKDFLAKIKASEEAGTDDDKTYKIGKDDLNQQEYDALLADFKKKNDLTDEDIKGMNEKALNKQLDVFSKQENRRKGLNEESQIAAQVRRDLAKQAEYFEGKFKEFDAKKENLEKKQKELEAVIAKNPEQEFEDIDDDEERKDKISDLRMDQKLAKNKLTEIKEEISLTDKGIKNIEKRVDDMAYHSTFIEINETIPALKLEKPAFEILNTNKRPSDLNQTKIASVHVRLAKDYLAFLAANPESEWTVSDYYSTNEYLYNPRVEIRPTSSEPKPKAGTESDRKKRILKVISDQQQKPFSVKSGGSALTNGRDKEDVKVSKIMKETGYEMDYKQLGVD